MKHQFRGLRNLLLGLALLASVAPAPVSGHMTQPAPPAQTGAACEWPAWSCTGVDYGSTPPSWAPSMTYITDYQSVLDCVNNITVSKELPGSGKVKLNCPGWPEPQTIRECPVNEVLREPYPRALVTVPITFTLIDNLVPKLNFATAPAPAKNSTYPKTSYGVMLRHGAAGTVTIAVRGTRLEANTQWLGQKVISPTWTFQDRPWRTATEYPSNQYNVTSTYQYAASSYGLPEKGRAFDNVLKLPSATDYDLPAYPVQLATPCKYEYRLIVQKSWPYWTFSNPARTAGQWNTQWVNVTTAWLPINLKNYAYPNTYEWWNLVRSGGRYKTIEYWDQPDPSQIWIPVLEVQSVLRSQQCAVGGGVNCPKAETDSITSPTGGVGGTTVGSLTGGGGGGGGSIITPPPPP